MAADSQFAIQQAIFTQLRATSAVTAFVGSRVYDGKADASTSFPYLLIGGSVTAPFDTKDTDGMDQTFEIHTFSKYHGNKEARQIMAAVLDALDEQTLSVTGHDLVFLYFFGSNGPFGDPDPDIVHGVQQFRAVTQAQ